MTPSPTLPFFSTLAAVRWLRFTGDDAPRFLQGQLTCNVLKLSPGQSVSGAICTAKGRVISTLQVLRTEQEFILLVPSELCETLRKRLQMYVMRAAVTIEAPPESAGLIGIASGEEGFDLGNAPAATIAGNGRCLQLVPCQDADAAEALSAHLRNAGFQNAAEEQFELELIRAGWPVVTGSAVEEYVPQMLNLDLIGGIAFDKGCYTGQEIVARSHYLGTLKRRMVRLVANADTLPDIGTRVLAENSSDAVGHVLSSAKSDDRTVELLAVLNTSAFSGRPLVLDVDTSIPLNMVDLPYAIPLPPES